MLQPALAHIQHCQALKMQLLHSLRASLKHFELTPAVGDIVM